MDVHPTKNGINRYWFIAKCQIWRSSWVSENGLILSPPYCHLQNIIFKILDFGVFSPTVVKWVGLGGTKRGNPKIWSKNHSFLYDSCMFSLFSPIFLDLSRPRDGLWSAGRRAPAPESLPAAPLSTSPYAGFGQQKYFFFREWGSGWEHEFTLKMMKKIGDVSPKIGDL